MPLTELRLGLPGQVFCGPMPFGLYDTEGEILYELKRVNISTVIVLAEEQECIEKAKCDLIALYQQEGIDVINLPTPNYGIPSEDRLMSTLRETIDRVGQGHKVLVHCSAGIGHTSLFAALLAKKVLGLSGNEAIHWVGQHNRGLL
jgi:protein-tyrosine phosphatase